ncbi:MAG: hypothetical protein MUD01_29045, partial [Chloroflexaceae bacterium]|nr:hypothetical protein [Chloroflexaceae bacterium]
IKLTYQLHNQNLSELSHHHHGIGLLSALPCNVYHVVLSAVVALNAAHTFSHIVRPAFAASATSAC